MIISCEAVILKTDLFFESDKRCVVFSDSFGVITCLAKHAAKSKRKLWALEPLSYVNLQLYKGKSFYLINSCNVTTYFSTIRSSFNRLQYSLFFLKIISKSMMPEQQNYRLYTLLKDTLVKCNQLVDINEVKLEFYKSFIELEGIQPEKESEYNEKTYLDMISDYVGYRFKLPLQLDSYSKDCVTLVP